MGPNYSWILLATRLALTFFIGLYALQSGADETRGDEIGEKPFAEARVVLQLSDAGAEHQSRVLNIANNLIKHYGGPDFIDIEVVAFGPGIELLYAANTNQERISSLAASGVRFMGCMNTVDTIERTTGTRPDLNSLTLPVQTGVAHLVQRAGEGYVIVKP
jgi:intracellular sulfur oxidation DsrE/DsrF family protein